MKVSIFYKCFSCYIQMQTATFFVNLCPLRHIFHFSEIFSMERCKDCSQFHNKKKLQMRRKPMEGKFIFELIILSTVVSTKVGDSSPITPETHTKSASVTWISIFLVVSIFSFVILTLIRLHNCHCPHCASIGEKRIGAFFSRRIGEEIHQGNTAFLAPLHAYLYNLYRNYL